MNLSNTLAVVFEPKQRIEKDRQRFSNRDLFRLILPILVEQLLTMLVGIADTLMVSYAGDAAVSGVSLVNQLNNIFIFIFGAVASGGAVVASQYVGRRDRENGVGAASQTDCFSSPRWPCPASWPSLARWRLPPTAWPRAFGPWPLCFVSPSDMPSLP